MDKIYLSKSFLKNPAYAVSALLTAIVLVEAINWLFSFERKIAVVKKFGGFPDYLYLVLRGMIIPELITTIIILALINLVHTWFRIYTVRLSWLGVLRYELLFLPVMAVAFLFFNPITQSIRYLMVEFPDYNFSFYWETYLLGTYSWRAYFLYLIPVLIIGYLSLNMSLLNDFIKSARNWKYQNPAVG
ncbi:hypothetical protein LX87_03447 [Larkinella arboricola]|uniref:Uncharacterized protein n=1 Tax=Larkinella arboricola TaxID=643671 RepID=A0A327X0H0_LARAB|nr:hypothetical protein [Larkinella arboricola]RAJ95699.1 hypothetical protein LX87_03447 [Larkinella arboricola]